MLDAKNRLNMRLINRNFLILADDDRYVVTCVVCPFKNWTSFLNLLFVQSQWKQLYAREWYHSEVDFDGCRWDKRPLPKVR